MSKNITKWNKLKISLSGLYNLGCSLEKWLIPTIKQRPPVEKKVASYLREMNRVLDQIETIWLENGQKKYICGDKISVADIVACCELEQPSMAG